MTTRTLGSAAMLYAKVPMPRMTIALLAGWSPAVMVMEGENFARSENPETFARVRLSPLTTVTAIGTFCRFSVRFCAVTTTSSSCVCGVSSASAGASKVK